MRLMPNCQYIAVAGEGQQDHKEQILRGMPSRRAKKIMENLKKYIYGAEFWFSFVKTSP